MDKPLCRQPLTLLSVDHLLIPQNPVERNVEILGNMMLLVSSAVCLFWVVLFVSTCFGWPGTLAVEGKSRAPLRERRLWQAENRETLSPHLFGTVELGGSFYSLRIKFFFCGLGLGLVFWG
mmetsp:Transcript_4826/g.7668  ORF Transcript_4826/g.7668 Transcript_4826/m.7668 type:complete len:121 (+) Transcript_4826:212-574(+)